jgi:S-adenosylmethionine-dependent methyltransferase
MSRESEMVKRVYSTMVENEWERLTRDALNRLEYATTWRFLTQYLPSRGLVLDAGGGPGRYTIDLAHKGYEVVLLDLTPANLERARLEIDKSGVGTNIKDVTEGTITDLSRYNENTYDAVLCTGGPLSHVGSPAERQKALSELVRVAKPGAPIFVSVMSKYGVLLATPTGWPNSVGLRKEVFLDIIESGECYTWLKDGYCHFYTAGELESQFESLNVEIVQKVGLEGLNNQESAQDYYSKYPEAWQKWLEIHHAICTDPFVVDASSHMLFVVKKGQLK